MVIIMPNQSGNSSLLMKHQTSIINSALRKLNESSVENTSICGIYLPKFTIRHRILNLKSVFQSMNVQDIFSDLDGNFSRITTTQSLYLQNIDHKTVLKVDENGVNANTVRPFFRDTKLRRNPTAVFAIKYPFLFMIRHKQTKTILFLGKVNHPKE